MSGYLVHNNSFNIVPTADRNAKVKPTIEISKYDAVAHGSLWEVEAFGQG